MNTHFSDSTLIQRVLDGDTELFGELVIRYQGYVYGLAYNSVGNFADAQDVAAGTDEWEFPSDYQIHDDRPIMSVVFNTLALLDIPFEAGFAHLDSEDAICYHADPAAHTLLVTVPRTGCSAVVSLDEHLSGLGNLHRSAEALEPHGTFSDDYGHYYHLRISANQDTITVCLIACKAEDVLHTTS
jgi:hypothetical protein